MWTTADYLPFHTQLHKAFPMGIVSGLVPAHVLPIQLPFEC
jgi:hypothetical protein